MNLEGLKKTEQGRALILRLAENPERPVPLEDNVQVQGLKNPICVVIVGFATDGVLKGCLNNKKKEVRHIIVIEPDISIFHQTMRRFYLAEYFDNDMVEFLVGIPLEQIRPELFKLMTAYTPKFGNRASTSNAPEVILDPFVYGPGGLKPPAEGTPYNEAVADSSRQAFLSMGCAADGFNRVEQFMKNEQNLFSCFRVKGIMGKLNKIPAIVVGAGPSMPDFIRAYHEQGLGEKAVIIACDAALKRLLAENVRPHIVVRCERKFTQMFDGLTKEDTKGIYYAAYPWAPSEFFQHFENNIMLFRNNGLCKWSGLDVGDINGGVSSANAAMEIAWELGANWIFLTGVDLCFADGKSHCEGTEVEFDISKSEPKWTKEINNKGEEVTTIPIWHRCKNEYENAIVKYRSKRGVNVYNMSPIGVRIEGTEVVDWKFTEEKLKGHYDVTKLLRANLDKLSESDRDNFAKVKQKTLDTLAAARKAIQKCFLFLEDSMTNSVREEQKAICQIKTYYGLTDAFVHMKALEKNLVQMYEGSARSVDEVKYAFFTNEVFAAFILDICQLDLFLAENKINSLKNLVVIEHERVKNYIGIHHNLYRILDYYCDMCASALRGEFFIAAPQEEAMVGNVE